jgi:hypothetical protein
MLTDPEYVELLAKRLKIGKAPHMEIFFAQHLWGKPKERIEITATDITALELILVEARGNGGSGNGHSGPSNGDSGPTTIDITPDKESEPSD